MPPGLSVVPRPANRYVDNNPQLQAALDRGPAPHPRRLAALIRSYGGADQQLHSAARGTLHRRAMQPLQVARARRHLQCISDSSVLASPPCPCVQ